MWRIDKGKPKRSDMVHNRVSLHFLWISKGQKPVQGQ